MKGPVFSQLFWGKDKKFQFAPKIGWRANKDIF